jgi:hypothetical protein
MLCNVGQASGSDTNNNAGVQAGAPTTQSSIDEEDSYQLPTIYR